jgi:broad specificity phosphatase PhoE
VNKYLILVKHSLPEIVENIPARDWHLSKDGQLRAERLAKRLLTYNVEVLISSVEPKAIETALTIAEVNRLNVQIMEGLHEHDRNGTPYLSADEFQNSVREFFQKPNTLVFGNETAEQAHKRFSGIVHSVLETHPDKRVIIVAHGTVISLFVSHLTGAEGFSLWKELGLPGFVVLDINSNTLVTQENIP